MSEPGWHRARNSLREGTYEMELYPLLSGESIELRAFEPGSQRPLQRFLPSWDDLYEHAVRMSFDYDVYFGVAPRTPSSDGKLHGREENIKRIPALWLDLDAKGDFTKEQRLQQLHQAEPTYVVDSGHGLHAYWVLDEPVAPFQARWLMKGMARALQCDDTSDPPRILRVPGTLNHKHDKQISVVLIGPKGQTWRFSDIPFEPAEPDASTGNGALDHALRASLIEHHGIAKGGEAIEGQQFDGRDAALFELACFLRDSGIDKVNVLQRCKSANALMQPPLSDAEVATKVKSAFTREPAPNIVEVVEAPSQQRAITKLQMISMHDLAPPVPAKWFNDPYFTANRLVLLDGEEGIGKSALCAMLAVQHSLERPFVWFTAEDDPQHDVNPRLRAAAKHYGISISDVHVHYVMGDPRYNADSPEPFEALEDGIRNVNACMLIFDPGRSFLGPREGQRDFSHNNEADVRPTLQRLSRMAVNLGIGAVFGHHWNKQAAAPLRYRTTGTGAYRQVVRHQVSLIWDHNIEDGVIGVNKSNIAPTNGTVRNYHLEIVDDQPVFVIGEPDSASTLDLWASERSRAARKAITVIEPSEVVERLRDWAFTVLKPGDRWPTRDEIVNAGTMSQAEAKMAVPILKQEDWIVREGKTFVWKPAWTPED